MISASGSGTDVTVSGVAKGIGRVTVTASDGSLTAVQHMRVTVAAIAPPTGARYTREGSTIVLNWNASPGATHYNIYYDDFFDSHCFITYFGDPAFCEELATNVRDTTYTHTDPDDHNNYYWISACNSEECSRLRWVGLPSRATVSVVGRDHNSLTVRLRSSNAEYLELHRSTSEDGPYLLADESIESHGEFVTHVDDGLSPDAVYYYKAAGCVDVGCSELSEVTAGVTEVAGPVEIPPVPTGLRGRKVNIRLAPDDARIDWDPTPRATYYKVYQDGQYEAEISAPRTSYYDGDPNTFVGALSSTAYQVRACNKAGCSPSTKSVIVR